MGRWMDPDEHTKEYQEACEWYWNSPSRRSGPAGEKAKCLEALWAGHQGVSVFFLEGSESKWVQGGLLDLLRKHGVELLAELIEQASMELYGSKLPPPKESARLKPFDAPDNARAKELFKQWTKGTLAGDPYKLMAGEGSRGKLTTKIDNAYPLPFDYYMNAFARLCRELQEITKGKKR